MCEPRTIEIPFVIYEYLRLIDETAKRGRMNNAIAVTLKLATIGGRIFRVPPPSRVGRCDGVGS